ncbi:hypothetical protein MMC10_010557 [Thelotrema lepadinum]|nr:hypothetical protein [Thelotrema lepadinum]
MKETQLHNFELYSHFFPGVKQIGVEFCIDGINYSSDRRHLAGLAFRTSGFHEFRVALGKALITSSYPFVTNEPKLQLGVSCYPELREIQCWACISKASTCEVELTLSNRIEDNDFYRQDINSWFAMRHQFYGGGYSHLELKDYTMDRLEALAQNELNKRVAAGTTTGRPPAWKLNDYKSLVLRWRRSILIAKREAEEERLRLMEEEKRKKMEHVRSFKRGGANWTPELEAERERKKVEREKKRAKKFSQLSYSNRDGIPQD